MKKKNICTYLILLAAFILTSLIWYYAVFNFLGATIDQLKPTLKLLVPFFTGVIGLIAFFSVLRELFIKKISKAGWYILLGIVGVLIIYNVVGLIYFSDFYLGNPTNTFRNIFIILLNVVYLGLGIFCYVLVRLDKLGDISELSMFKGLIGGLDKKGTRVGYIFYSLFALYFVGDFLVSFVKWGNYWCEPFWYPFLLLFILLPGVNMILARFRGTSKGKMICSFTMSGVNLLFIVLMAVLTFTNYYAIEKVGQSLFFADFSISLPFGPVVICILLVVSTTLNLIYSIKGLKNKGDSAVTKKAE